MSKLIGLVAVVAGTLFISAGALYVAGGWRYGGIVLWWTVMWGLMVAGLGVVLATRRTTVGPALGALACGLSALLVVLWQREGGELGWWKWLCGLPAVGGLILGLSMSVRNLRKRRKSDR